MANVFMILFSSFIIILSNLSHTSANGTDEKAAAEFYELKKDNFSVKFTNYGARIVSLLLPNRNGEQVDVVLGYDTVSEYLNDTRNFGAILGRVANRISGAQFTLNGTVYKLTPNSPTSNVTSHGGKFGFSKVIWDVKEYVYRGSYPYITLSYFSKDGEEGFPGAVSVDVTYTLSAQPYKLSITMKANVSNKATPVNLAQHTYWNLGGHASGVITSDTLQLFASYITPTNDQNIPTGEIKSVNNTGYDFTISPHVIKDQFEKLPKGSEGYDINYVIDGYNNGKLKPVATVYNAKSGIKMNLSSTAPGVQMYTANYLKNIKGKGGNFYNAYSGICLETQGFPDAVNHPNFPSQIVTPGQTYEHDMILTFGLS